MTDWEHRQTKAALYERLCRLADDLLEITHLWWDIDPHLALDDPPHPDLCSHDDPRDVPDPDLK